MKAQQNAAAGVGFTPGPWRTGDLYHTVFGPPNGNPSPETIATVNANTTIQNRRANARLIASAPDLLSASQFALGVLVTLRGSKEVFNAITALENAIAKATGNQ